MNQEMKKQLAPGIKKVLKKYGLRGTIGVEHYSGLVVRIWEGPLDFIGNRINNMKPHHIEMYGCPENYIQVNPHWIEDTYTGEVKKCLMELKKAMNGCEAIQNFDKSDPMTDYFHVGWYVYINVGEWDKYYKLQKEQKCV